MSKSKAVRKPRAVGINISMPSHLGYQLRNAAELERRPVSWVARAAIQDYIKREHPKLCGEAFTKDGGH